MSLLSGNIRLLIRKLRGEKVAEDYRRAGAKIGSGFLENGLVINLNDCPFVTIGDNVVLGPRVLILAHDAALRARVGYTRMEPVLIESDAFVGAGSIILPGTSVGQGAVIAAGSVVRGLVPSGEVWGGVPARHISSVEKLVERAVASMSRMPRFESGWKSDIRRSGPERERILSEAAEGGWFY